MSPLATAGARGSEERTSSKITLSSGLGRVVRRETSAERSVVTASQRPSA